MNRDDYLNTIAKNFGRLTHEIRALNAIGRFDINSVAEDFLVPVLRVCFSCPDLQNQNEIQMNFPAVDLGCRTKRIFFQVTTDASSGKAEKTLRKFQEHSLEKFFDCVYILALTEKQSSYKASALSSAVAGLSIHFDPAKHIIDITDLLSQIRRLDSSDLERINTYLALGWAERDRMLHFREQLEKFLEFSTKKVELEKRSRKYIPSIFVETHSTKEEVRLFANPLFFFRKIQDHLAKLDYSYLNSIMKVGHEPEFNLDIDGSLLKDAPSTFGELQFWLDQVNGAVAHELRKVRPLSWRRDKGESPYQPVSKDTVNWTIARVKAEGSATGLTLRLQDSLDFIALIQKKIFLVTSMAGQGKTNFVCDLVENQFRLFAVPCLFIPARELNSYAPGKRLFEYISNNRYAPAALTIHEYLKLFNNIAMEVNKPFLVVVDGINEVSDLTAFCDELKSFCNALCQYDAVKIIITCRSEFFDERYASILDEPFADQIHRVGDLRSRMTELSKSRLLRSYLTHFEIAGEFSNKSQDFLKGDLLLLRIFCERHQNSNVGYMADIYKGDLFEEYLLKKIRSFPQHIQGRALPTLYNIVTSMLTANDFSKLSVRSFAAEEHEIVRRFIEEDVILRQEIGVGSLSALGDLSISFTYDELRDFIIAYKLVIGDAKGDAKSLKAALDKLPGKPICEGVFRYSYLLARKTNDAAAIVVCEDDLNFLEHFSLNVHLLPPAVQTRTDVERVKALLADGSAPERLRRAAVFLVHRRDISELLSITILLDHLNGLETAEHKEFIRALFAHRYDHEASAWRERAHSLIHDVAEANSEKVLERRDSRWLAFFLHVSSLAGWSERERVSTMFRNAIGASNCCDAIEFVRPAQAKALQNLLLDIEDDRGIAR